MQIPKWLIVARNEYRIRTSIIRKIRPYFPYLVTGILAIYILFVTPAVVNLLMDDFIAFILSQAAVAMVQIVLFLIFIYFMIAPITTALREQQIEQLHIFLSAPVKPGDVLLGEFLGAVPLYAILITIITGFFTALLDPLGLNVIQIAIIIIIFVVIFLSAIWIGTVIAALLKTKFGKTAHGQDIGRALAMILVLPLVAMFYIIAYGGLLETLSDPEASGMVRILLGWLPSSWGADVIVGFAFNPGDIAAAGVEPLAKFGGLLIFFVGALWLGTRAADYAYRLEITTFISPRANPDSIFYKAVKFLGGGGSFSTLVVSVFKDYARRLENISNISYMVGVLFLMTIFLGSEEPTGPDDPPIALMSMLFIFPIVVVMVTGEVTVRGKESLFIYRKAPFGEDRFIKAMLVKSWFMAVPLAGVVVAAVTLVSSQTTFGSLVIITGLMMMFVAAFVVFVLGLFLLNPALSEKSVKLWINVMAVVFASIGLFAVSLLILTRGGSLSEPIGGLLSVQALQMGLAWVMGIVFLGLGKRRLSRIE